MRAAAALHINRPVELQLLYPDLGVEEPITLVSSAYDLDQGAFEPPLVRRSRCRIASSCSRSTRGQADLLSWRRYVQIPLIYRERDDRPVE